MLRRFFGTTRRMVDVLNAHIMNHNPFVARWTARMKRAAAKEAAREARRQAGLFLPPRTSRVGGNFGDVEFACYESWVTAFKNNDNHGMMDAVKQAMNDDFSRQQVLSSASDI